MSDQPLTTGGLRGAVDLTALRSQPAGGAPRRAPGAERAAGACAAPRGRRPAGVAGRTGVVVEGTDTNFQEIANASVGVPMLLVLWAAQIPESRDYLDTVVAVAGSLRGPLPGRQHRRRAEPHPAARLPGAERPGDDGPDPGPAGADVRRHPARVRPAPGPRGVPRPGRAARRDRPGRPRTRLQPRQSTATRSRSSCRRCTRRPTTRSSAATSTVPPRHTSRR